MTSTIATKESRALSFVEWRDRVRDEYVALDIEADGTGVFRGALATFEMGSTSLGDLAHEALRVRRTPDLIDAADVGLYKVSVQLEGYSAVEQDGRETVVGPADITVYDTTRPFTITTNDSARALILGCPRDRFGLSDEIVRAVTATRISGRTGLGSGTAAYLVGVERALDADGARTSAQLEAAVLGVLRSTITLHAEGLGVSADDGRLATLRSWVEAHLADPDLGVQRIANAHFMSVRQVQRVFRQGGTTVTDWIRSRRLDHCRIELECAADGVVVRDVAVRWGIQDAAHFSHLFRQVFGRSPSEYRLEHLTADETGRGRNDA
ncbi:helix-turn-helix domain-containing protein [Curtobacterium sp. VKM Ac-1376]|uniref:AraC-like ligand-binding domain-containing protein n=1 Tax=Curtobacterium sp. VKM Ac-1376 TaxID=123312 RepID=UPI001889D3F9|nr:helix-turn-helix domain-containing protein [Curtobacterium sp. VKM Ac-1376]MBF4616029.1 helix-turn-helix domain-containing protein [Curtobacterium sp. VKM Ac-1376]